MHTLFSLIELTNQPVSQASTGQDVNNIIQTVVQDVKLNDIPSDKRLMTKEKIPQRPTSMLRSPTPDSSSEDYGTLSRKVLSNLETMQKSKKVVVYTPEGGAGFGNYAGGLVTLFTIAVCKGAAFKSSEF